VRHFLYQSMACKQQRVSTTADMCCHEQSGSGPGVDPRALLHVILLANMPAGLLLACAPPAAGVPAAQQTLLFAGCSLPDEGLLEEHLHLDMYSLAQEVSVSWVCGVGVWVCGMTGAAGG
jgi:hypothetical protein